MIRAFRKTDITVNVKYNGETLRTYTDRVRGESYELTAEQQRHVRRGNDIYCLPGGTQTVYELDPNGGQKTIDIELEKISGNNIALFEDFCDDKTELERRRITGSYTVDGGSAVISEGGTLEIPSVGENIRVKVECGGVTGEITALGTDVTQSLENGKLTAEGYITSLSGSGTVDNLMVSIADPVITGLENGTYTLKASVRRYDLDDTAYLSVKTDGAPVNRASAAGNDTWRETVIQGIDITDGTCELGISGAAQFADISLTKETEESRSEFLVGGDITEVSYVESCGGKYYDENGVQADPIQLLAERGFNFARVRVYNDPGKGHGDGTYYLPAGFQNVEDGLSLSKRAKDKGMQVELTLYYSDYWADGSRQLIPHEWAEEIADLSEDDKITRLGELIYEYTKDVMEKMKAQDTLPEYVSLGNEMQGGLLYGPGYSYGRTSTNNFKNLAYFLNQGAKAVREVSPETKIVLHLDGKMSQYQSFFDNCEANDVDYDVIGPSYYPYWTGNTVDEIVDFYNGLIERYDKDILVMETGYNFNPTKPDGSAGQLADNGPYQTVYESSPEGQRAFMEEVFQGLRSVAGGRCIGDLYWDPMMIYHEGVGWAYRESDDQPDINVVSNTTLFDFEGKALPAFDAFLNNGYTPGTVGIGGTVTDSDGNIASNETITVSVNGTDYSVDTDKMGGYFMRIPYADTLEISAAGNETAYTLDMTDENIATGIDLSLSYEIEQPEAELINGGFEDEFIGSDNWNFTNTGGWYSCAADRDTSEKSEGEYSVKLENGTVGQRVTLEAGKTYRFSAMVKGSGKVRLGLGDGAAEFPASNFVAGMEFDTSETWSEQHIDFVCTETKDYVIIADSYDGTVNYVDDAVLTDLTNKISSFDVLADENGISYKTEYLSDKENAVLYTALYDENGILLGCEADKTEGSFAVSDSDGKRYVVKAFLWDGMTPLDMSETTIVLE